MEQKDGWRDNNGETSEEQVRLIKKLISNERKAEEIINKVEKLNLAAIEEIKK